MSCVNLPIAALCLLGFVISAYAFSVELRADEARRLGTEFKAACDIGPFSCTKVFSSEFGHVTAFFGLPKISNAALGMSFYLLESLCCWSPTLMLLLSAQALLASLGFGYILFFVLHDLCIVCCSIYAVNILTALLSYRWWRASRSRGSKSRSSRSRGRGKSRKDE